MFVLRCRLLGQILLLRYASLFLILGTTPASSNELPGNLDIHSTMPQYIDLHVHTAGLGNDSSGIYVHPKLKQSYKFSFYLQAFGVTEEDLNEHGDRLILSKIATKIRKSIHLKRSVILALDGVINDEGALDYGRTQIYVPNDFLIRELPAHPELLFGASVNPYRKDALTRLDQAVRNGAVLLKWIPNIMHIDPADPKIIPFYKRLAQYKLPLLTHTGQERAFEESNDLLGDPQRLKLPLSLGVTVIAAHIATTGSTEKQGNFERLITMFEKYQNLYADISSLTQINKLNYLARALQIPNLEERLIYGSDWPLQRFPLVSPLYHLNHIGFGNVSSILRIQNQWDRDVRLKQALGVPPSVFKRTEELLKPFLSKRNTTEINEP